MKLGERIRQNRIDKGLTQQDLAEMLNVSRPTISNWETGRSYPDLESLVMISNLFEESLDRLLKGDEQTVKRMNLDMLKGRKLKRILAVAFVPILMLAAYLSWMVYADKQKEVVAIEDVYSLALTTEEGLSKETEIKGEVKLGRNETVLFPTVTQIDGTIYFYVLKSPGLRKTSEFTVSLEKHSNLDAVEQIVMVSGETFNRQQGYGPSDFSGSASQKVIWKREPKQ